MVENLSNPEDVRKSLRYWRKRVFISLWIAYASFYLCRVNMSIAIPGILEEYNLTKTAMGAVLTALFFAYAVGQFINGQLGDKFGARKLLTFGAIVSAILNLIFAVLPGIVSLMALVWGLNGYFQSMGWSPATKTIANWFPLKMRGKITVSADGRTNALIVTAPAEAMKTAEDVIARLDTPEAAEAIIATKLIPLQHADADEVAATLNAALGAAGGSRSRRQGRDSAAGKLIAVAYAGSQSVLLTGRKADIEFAEGLIAEFDARAGAQTRIYSLQHARAEAIARTLLQTVGAQQPRGRRDRSAAAVSIAADGATNTVVVSGGPDVHRTVAALLAELDSPETVERAPVTKVVSLTNADAEEMARTLTAALAGSADPSGRRGGGAAQSLAGRQLGVVPNVSARSVLLTGSQEDVACAAELTAQLDARASAETIRSYRRLAPDAADRPRRR